MKKFVEKLKCCSNVVTQMLSATLEATREKSTFGWESNNLLLLLGLTFIGFYLV